MYAKGVINPVWQTTNGNRIKTIALDSKAFASRLNTEMSRHYLRLVWKIIPVHLVHSVHVDIYSTSFLYRHSDHISQAGNIQEMEFLTEQCLICENRKTQEMPGVAMSSCHAMLHSQDTRAFKIEAWMLALRQPDSCQEGMLPGL